MPSRRGSGNRELSALLGGSSSTGLQGHYWAAPSSPSRAARSPKSPPPGMWSSSSAGASVGFFPSWMRSTVGPLLLMVVTLPFPPLMAWASVSPAVAGSGAALLAAAARDPAALLRAAYGATPLAGYLATLRLLGAHSAWQLALMRLVPGPGFSGPVTASGHVPRYRDNGVVSFLLTVAAFFGLSTWSPVGKALPSALQFSPTVLYDHYLPLLCALPLAAFALCLVLLVKGLTCPSSRDSGSSGNIVIDFFWGTELYPRFLGWDIKQFTNCRHGLMLWPLLPLSFAAHAFEAGALTSALFVNVALQVVYCFKFFVWEKGYMSSMDIAHDRTGYMIAWGCLSFVPSMYVCHSWWMVKAVDRALAAGAPPPDVPLPAAAALGALGLLAIWANYDADLQRMQVRADPTMTVWGAPAVVVKAPYLTEAGEHRSSVLLASGWWGLASHFHYVPEVAAALLWSLPAGGGSAMPYLYVAFLAVLLLDRAYRDDARCAAKYGKAWEKYRALVPYKIVPGVV